MKPALFAAASARTRRLLALLACAAVALTFVVIVASAFIRHTQAGLGCVDWPSCYARVTAEPHAMSPTIGIHVARTLHRLAASSALLVIIGILLVARAAKNHLRERVLAVAALVLALCLAVLGIATPDAELPAVPLGNLVGGYLMIAVLAMLAGSAASAPSESRCPTRSRLRSLALLLLAVIFVQAVLGGLIGTQFALPSCPALDHCAGATGNAFAVGAALDPFHRPVVVAGHVVAPAGAGELHAMHRWLGIAIALAALALAFALRSSHRRGATLLAGLALAAPLLGATAILHMPSLTITVLHNATAAAMIATLTYMLAQGAYGITAQGSTRRAFSIRRRSRCSEASESGPIRPVRP